MSRGSVASGVRDVLDAEEVREVLRDTFFVRPNGEIAKSAPSEVERIPVRRGGGKSDFAGEACAKARPDHYKVICISLYTEDLARLDGAVRTLKQRGFTKANRSAVLRVAMEQLNLDRIKRGL